MATRLAMDRLSCFGVAASRRMGHLPQHGPLAQHIVGEGRRGPCQGEVSNTQSGTHALEMPGYGPRPGGAGRTAGRITGKG
jgi:hypothetical protein